MDLEEEFNMAAQAVESAEATETVEAKDAEKSEDDHNNSDLDVELGGDDVPPPTGTRPPITDNLLNSVVLCTLVVSTSESQLK
jgi:hypothetical protein